MVEIRATSDPKIGVIIILSEMGFASLLTSMAFSCHYENPAWILPFEGTIDNCSALVQELAPVINFRLILL